MGVAREFEGQDLDKALDAASRALGVGPAELEYEIVDEGRRGVFGLGARPVRIAVGLPPEQAERRGAGVMPAPREVPAHALVLEETVQRILRLTGLELEFRSRMLPAGVRIDLSGPDRRLLLQRDGELLAALQFLLQRMGRRGWPELGRVDLQCQGFRHRRDDDLVKRIQNVAAEVARTGSPRRLEPMNPYERRLVHMTAREIPGLVTDSEGEGFMKSVTVRRSEE
jgi:spoIIIJ-associated protein